MKKKIFLKNLLQSISFFASIMVIEFSLLSGYFYSLKYENNNGWALLLIALMLILLFFAGGFYWIFQTVEIDECGIKVKLFNKTIRNVSWTQIEAVESSSVMRNPVYVLIIKGEKNINLDHRRAIKNALVYYGGVNAGLIVESDLT